MKHDDVSDHFPDTSETASRDDSFTTHASHAPSALPSDILELLQHHTEELLRTHRDNRGTSDPDARIVDPWALIGANSTATSTSSNPNTAAILKSLLTLTQKLLAKLESPIKNPFNFLP